MACLLLVQVPAACAHSDTQSGTIEQNFAPSLRAVPTAPFAAPLAFYVPIYSSAVAKALMFGGLGAGHDAFIAADGRSGWSGTTDQNKN